MQTSSLHVAPPRFAQWPWKSFSWPRSPFSTSEAALPYRPQPPGLVEKTNSITQTPLGKFCATWEFSWTKVQSLVLLSLKIDVTLTASPHPPVPWRTRGPLNLWTAFLLGRDYMTIAKSLPSYWPQTWASVRVLLRADGTQGFSGNLLPITLLNSQWETKIEIYGKPCPVLVATRAVRSACLGGPCRGGPGEVAEAGKGWGILTRGTFPQSLLCPLERRLWSFIFPSLPYLDLLLSRDACIPFGHLWEWLCISGGEYALHPLCGCLCIHGVHTARNIECPTWNGTGHRKGFVK